jgi:hypothetical protein
VRELFAARLKATQFTVMSIVPERLFVKPVLPP